MHISEGLEGVLDVDRPVEALVHHTFVIHGNVCDQIGDLNVHVLDFLNELLHFQVVAGVEWDDGQLVQELVLLPLEDDSPVQARIHFGVVHLHAIVYIPHI